jgi:hypothetical protein
MGKIAAKKTRQVNLTKSLHKACVDLKKMRSFNGLYVLYAEAKPYTDHVKECRDDGMSKAQAEQWSKDYACVSFHLDTDWADNHSESDYVESEFNYGKLERDFKAWLLPYIGGDESLLPKNLNLDGGDTEFQRPGSEFPEY